MRLIDADALVTIIKGLCSLANILSGCREKPNIPYDDVVRMIEKSPTIEPEQRWIPCNECARNADNGGLYDDGRTRCPIQEHYVLLKDGHCHLAEPYREEGEK